MKGVENERQDQGHVDNVITVIDQQQYWCFLVLFGKMEPNREGERWEDPEEDDQNADHDILLVLINYAHADEGDWKAQGRGYDDDLLKYRHSQRSCPILFS